MVLVGGSVLIFAMTLRPWAGTDNSSETHLNYNYGQSRADYSRSPLTYVGEPPGPLDPWVPSKAAMEADNQGLANYVGYGCAGCHGIDGEGVTIFPPVGGEKERRVETLTRKGPGGMPAYDEAHISPETLGAITRFIVGLPEIPETPEPVALPEPTPYPTATPIPTPTPLPTPTPTPTATPLPPGAPTPTPTPTPLPPTPTPTPDPVRLAEGRDMYAIVGCDLCHGADALGADDGPGLEGLTAEEIRDFTRDPVNDPASGWSKPMDPYPPKDLSEAEMDLIIYFLQNLPG